MTTEPDKDKAAAQGLRVFIYLAESDPKTLMVGRDLTVGELATQAGIVLGPDDSVMEDLATETDAEDGDEDQEQVAPETRLEQLAGSKRVLHIVVHPCKSIMITIQYQSQTAQRRFSPARTVGQVRRWALRKFKLNDAATDKLLLQVCGTQRRPSVDTRLASLVGRACAVCFDLVPDRVVEG